MGAVHFQHGLCRGCYDEVNEYATCSHGFYFKKTEDMITYWEVFKF